MKKRQDAPGELELVREFINTLDMDPGVEELREPGHLRTWLSARGLTPVDLPVSRADLRRAIELREALRGLLVAHTGGEPVPEEVGQTLDAFAERARLRLRFDARGGSAVAPTAGGVQGAFGRLLAIVHTAMADGSWTRLKACRDDGCAWAFYDHTKNGSGTWCSMETCGNRAKARSYRGRRAEAGKT